MNNNFELLKDRVKLFDLLDADLNLKKSGRVHKACCPFHQENTPSFTVWQKQQTFHCFGCGKGGTVIDYIMYRENIKEPYEAVEYMAEKYNIAIVGFDKETIQRKRETVKKKRSKAIENFKNVKMAESFLFDRGFNTDTLTKFGIGFSITQNAITIPFLDTYGNVVGESVRNLDDDKPKYVNAREDEVFRKSELLYGMDKARKEIDEKIYIVEGYFDVMAMYQMGYKETVAYCGSSLTDEQATLISKYVNPHTKIFLVPDNDKTGLQNAPRNIKLLKKRMANPIGVYVLPDGIKDPNDVLKLGTTIDSEFIKSEHHEMFLLKLDLDKCLEQTDEYEVARLHSQKTQNEIIRSEMADYLAERWSKPAAVVSKLMNTKELINFESETKSFTESLNEFRESLFADGKNDIFFNLSKVDSKIDGMKSGEVAFLMGRSGSGKTTMALNLIYNTIVHKSQNVIFNSLELKAERIVPQLLQIHFAKTQNEIAYMVKNNKDDAREVQAFINLMDKHLRIVDRAGQTTDDIEKFAMMANESDFGEPISLMVIDYFGYIKLNGTGNDYADKSNAARKMKEIAKRLNCLVFVLTQTSRDGGTDGSTPLSLQSARDTGAIEETGDYVFGVYWPAVSSELSDSERYSIQSEYFVQILKNRWGGLGNIQITYDPKHKRMID